MPTRTITFSTYSDTGGATAWGPGNSTPAFPSGYTILADPCRITAGQLTKFSGTGNSILLDDTPLTSDIIEAEVSLGAVTSDSEGPIICSPAGVGWMILSNSTNVRLFNLTSGGVLGTQVTGNAAAMASNSVCRLRYTQSLDRMELFDDNVLTMTWNSVSSANTDWRAGAGVRNAGSLVSLSSIYTASQTVVSINSGNDIIQGAVGVVASLTGFSSRPTSITTNQTGLTCSNIGGTTNAPTFDLSGWAEGQQYPSLPVNVNFTFTFNTETTTGTETVTYPLTHTKVVFSSTPDITSLDGMGYWLNAAGHTVAGGDWYHTTFSDLVCDSDARISVTGTGTFTGWFRPASGGTAGRVYYWEFEVVDGSITSATGGLVTRGLTETGLITGGLVTRGL